MRLPVSILLALQCAACLEPPSSSSSSSSSSGSGSSSSSSSSSGSGAETIEFGALCRELRSGFRRALLRSANRCGAAYVDADLERMNVDVWPPLEAQSFAQARGQLGALSCDQFGNLRMYLDHVGQSVDRGRVRFDADAAFKCRAASTLPVLVRKDRPPIVAGDFSLVGVPLPAPCADVLQGLLPAGAPCDLTHECAGGRYCRPVSDDTAVGTCVDKVPVGNTCDTRDECDEGGFCDSGTCRAALGVGESCQDASGFALPCGAGLLCSNGLCLSYGAVGDRCASDTPPCRDALVCSRDTPGTAIGHCAVPADDAAPCVSDSQCGDCHYCSSVGRCAPFQRDGETCIKGNVLCAPGLECTGDGTCRMQPRLDEPCAVVAASDRTDEGNCQYADTFCARASATDLSGTCRRYAVRGEACGNAAATAPRCVSSSESLYCSDPAAGTCVPGALLDESCSRDGTPIPACSYGFCRREAADAGTGLCTVLPNIGEACGTPAHLSLSCRNGFCRRLADSPEGVCAPNPNIGEACGTRSHLSGSCNDGACFLQPGATEGTCRYLRRAGEACAASGECDTGTCDPYVARCITPGQSCQGCTRFEPILFVLSLGMLVRRRRR